MYKTVIALLFVYGVGHMVYTPFEYARMSDSALWFFSGGLLLLAVASVNLLNRMLAAPLTKALATGLNALLLVFCALLAAYIPEVQVYVLVAVQALALYCAITTRTRQA